MLDLTWGLGICRVLSPVRGHWLPLAAALTP